MKGANSAYHQPGPGCKTGSNMIHKKKGGQNQPPLYRAMAISSGIKAELMHYTLGEAIVSKLETEKPVFGFGFCISGFTRSRISCFNKEFEIRGGQSAVYYFPEIKVWSQTSSKEAVWRMSVSIPSDVLREMIDSDSGLFPSCVKRLALGKSIEPFRITGKIKPRMRQLMMQILHCPYTGVAAAYFAEAKVMELIACKLDELSTSSGKKKSRGISSLKKDDIDRLYFARDLLNSRVENPPELCELARLVGISRTKLINGFGHIFGTTPGAYLRVIRLKRAKQLLLEKEKNLTEIALMVGYASSSHFSKVFSAYYGVPPSKYAGMNSKGCSC